MKKKLASFLLLFFSNGAVAGKVIGAVDTVIVEPTTISSEAVIVVTANQKNSSPNIDFYSRRFADSLRTKYPNTFYGRDGAGREPDIIVSVQASSVLLNDTGEETIYSEEPKSWRCSEYIMGTECRAHETTKRVVGSRSVTYTFAGYKINTSWMFVNDNGYEVKFFSQGSLMTDVETGMCTNSEAFDLVSKAIVDFSRPDEPVEKKFSFASPKKAGCKGAE